MSKITRGDLDKINELVARHEEIQAEMIRLKRSSGVHVNDLFKLGNGAADSPVEQAAFQIAELADEATKISDQLRDLGLITSGLHTGEYLVEFGM